MVENYRYLFKFQEERMKLVALVLVLAVTSNSMALMAGQTADTTNQTPGSKNAAKIKAEVQKRGIGKQARVKVTLRNDTEVRGYVSQIDDASFQVTNLKTQGVTTVAYADVKRVRGSGLSKAASVAIGIGVIAGVLILLAFSLPKD
jgi:biotin-(acetyl-CoA carboxylase) ligase